MAVEVVKEIKEAEIQAENLISEVHDYSKRLIKSQEEKAEKIINDANTEGQNIASEIIMQKEEEGRKEAELIFKSGRENYKKIKQVPEDRINEAVDLLIERIVKPHGSS